ncbi:hypothetical protein [Amycolatopsis minnesotensis]|uniref:Uncharacterized protein n=1 Tax=Amycolatopsis minnesotensis TaxID=337894 RepID=A0ABN2SHG5_9PSEU
MHGTLGVEVPGVPGVHGTSVSLSACGVPGTLGPPHVCAGAGVSAFAIGANAAGPARAMPARAIEPRRRDGRMISSVWFSVFRLIAGGG